MWLALLRWREKGSNGGDRLATQSRGFLFVVSHREASSICCWAVVVTITKGDVTLDAKWSLHHELNSTVGRLCPLLGVAE